MPHIPASHFNLAVPTKQISVMLQQFLLYSRIARRTFEMFPRRRKSMRLLQLDSQPVEAGEDLMMLKYRFSNVIYYTIGGHKVMGQQVIMQRPQPGQEIPFTVHGFSKHNDYMLSLNGDDVVLTSIVQKTKPAEPYRITQPAYSLNLAQH